MGTTNKPSPKRPQNRSLSGADFCSFCGPIFVPFRAPRTHPVAGPPWHIEQPKIPPRGARLFKYLHSTRPRNCYVGRQMCWPDLANAFAVFTAKPGIVFLGDQKIPLWNQDGDLKQCLDSMDFNFYFYCRMYYFYFS